MTRRLTGCSASEVAGFTKGEKLQSLTGCEGRAMTAETIGSVAPLLGDVSNAELASALGADIVLLNLSDILHSEIEGLPEHAPEDTIRFVKKLTGRLIGINLEPAAGGAGGADNIWHMTEGRRATAENARHALDMGVDLIVVTGNPGIGVSNEDICTALKELSSAVGKDVILVAGKMHASGVLSESGRGVLTPEEICAFAEVGADIILMPAPGTVPGMTDRGGRGRARAGDACTGQAGSFLHRDKSGRCRCADHQKHCAHEQDGWSRYPPHRGFGLYRYRGSREHHCLLRDH